MKDHLYYLFSLCIYLYECICVCSHEHNLLSLKLLGFCYVQGICRLIWGLLTSVKYWVFPYREMFQVFLSSFIKLSFSLYLYSHVNWLLHWLHTESLQESGNNINFQTSQMCGNRKWFELWRTGKHRPT